MADVAAAYACLSNTRSNAADQRWSLCENSPETSVSPPALEQLQLTMVNSLRPSVYVKWLYDKVVKSGERDEAAQSPIMDAFGRIRVILWLWCTATIFSQG